MDIIAVVRPPKGGVKASVIGSAVLLPRRAESYKYTVCVSTHIDYRYLALVG